MLDQLGDEINSQSGGHGVKVGNCPQPHTFGSSWEDYMC